MNKLDLLIFLKYMCTFYLLILSKNLVKNKALTALERPCRKYRPLKIPMLNDYESNSGIFSHNPILQSFATKEYLIKATKNIP